MAKKVPPKAVNLFMWVLSKTPLARWGQPEDLVGALNLRFAILRPNSYATVLRVIGYEAIVCEPYL